MKQLTLITENGLSSMRCAKVEVKECYIVVTKEDGTQEIFTHKAFVKAVVK